MKNNFSDIKKYFLEMKLGGFFLGALILVFITLISMREITFFKTKRMLTVKFNFSEGLRTSSPVRFCGVDIGEVKEVEIRQDANKQPLVYVHIKVDEQARIPRNSYFFINSLSLFGEKYLEIVPPEDPQGYVSPGETVEGISPTPLFNVLTNFNKTMSEVNEFVKDGKVRTSFENIITNTEQITSDIKEVTANVKNKKGTIGRLFYDDSLYTKTEEFVDELKENPWKLLHKPRESRH
ncbi:MAG: MlaD family protein [Candidatus Omnitrophota bacterium]